MDIMQKFKEKARKNKKCIVLPEGNEPRVFRAAEKIRKQNLAEIILLGREEEIKEKAASENINLGDIKFINPQQSELIKEFNKKYFEIRKDKGISKKEAEKKIKDPLYFGTMLVHTDRADGMVAGSINATGDVLSPAFKIIKTKKELSVVSGAFIMDVPNCKYGDDGIIIFADCAVNPNPDAECLSEIAISTADTASSLLDMDPKVAMLSFSTLGSAKHELVDKVIEAKKLAEDKRPDLQIDGELQADAALVPEIAKTKSPGSKIAGKANILIFPDLQAGNIGYKLVQRLADAE
ncbi:MAG: phosphate acetyltransferase, partial [Halanaerobiales bacterium]